MELWDIYDENKERTGRTMKHNDWNMKPGEFHLTVLGVLMRPDGKYLITRRRMDKEWAAGWWEVPGGGVRAGEDSKDAVIREIKEETGIDVTNAEKFIQTASYLGKLSREIKRTGKPIKRGFKKIVKLCPKARKHLRLRWILVVHKHNKMPRLVSRLKPILATKKPGFRPALPCQSLTFYLWLCSE